MQRRTQAERSGEMRARLAQAAYELIALRGHSNFRTAAVAEQAGVSEGAMTHHFPTKEAVTLAAIEHALEVAGLASTERLRRPAKTASATFRLMIEDFIAFFHGDPFWVALDITMDGLKNETLAPAIREIVARHRGQIYARWAQRLVTLGWRAPLADEAVRMTAALVSGMAIRTLWTDRHEVDGLARRWIPMILSLQERS